MDGAKREPIDGLFQLPLADFTAARNALAATLKKAGDEKEGERVKALAKPPLSAWVANQLYWRHRSAFDRLLAAGDQFRNAQAAQLGGKSADLRGPLDARREALAQLTGLARSVLGESGHPVSPDTMRRIMTTLEALATYSRNTEGPIAGRLTGDVDPPGFEALASLVPGGGPSTRQPAAPTRVIPFSQPKRTPARQKTSPEEDARRREAERQKKQVEARKALLDAERALQAATRAAEHARAAMKKAAATAKEREKAKAALDARLEKVSADADAARQEARRVASHAEEAAQAMDDAERAVAAAREVLRNL